MGTSAGPNSNMINDQIEEFREGLVWDIIELSPDYEVAKSLCRIFCAWEAVTLFNVILMWHEATGHTRIGTYIAILCHVIL